MAAGSEPWQVLSKVSRQNQRPDRTAAICVGTGEIDTKLTGSKTLILHLCSCSTTQTQISTR